MSAVLAPDPSANAVWSGDCRSRTTHRTSHQVSTSRSVGTVASCKNRDVWVSV